MNVGGAFADGRSKHQLRPCTTGTDLDAVPRLWAQSKPYAAKTRDDQAIVEVVDPDLNVDAVLGGQAGHRGGADVIDASRQRFEGRVQPTRDGLKLPGPACVVVANCQGPGDLIWEWHL